MFHKQEMPVMLKLCSSTDQSSGLAQLVSLVPVTEDEIRYLRYLMAELLQAAGAKSTSRPMHIVNKF
jgi:hypothetical protein